VSVGHYENFPVASRLVPARLRPAVVAIYRFARAADDLADEGDTPPEIRLAALAAFDRALIAIGNGETPDTPPFPALAAAIRNHGLPMAPLHDLVSAFTQDVTVERYASYADVLDYCRRSANPVGRLVLALYGADTPANLRASDAVCLITVICASVSLARPARAPRYMRITPPPTQQTADATCRNLKISYQFISSPDG